MRFRYGTSLVAACRLSCSSTGDYLISGSEDGNVYVWRTNNDFAKSSLLTFNKHKCNSYEAFTGERFGIAHHVDMCATLSFLGKVAFLHLLITDTGIL